VRLKSHGSLYSSRLDLQRLRLGRGMRQRLSAEPGPRVVLELRAGLELRELGPIVWEAHRHSARPKQQRRRREEQTIKTILAGRSFFYCSNT
jgi:hypothetical protein